MASLDKVEGLRRALKITNISLIAVHTFLLFFFYSQHVYFMFFFNTVSIIFYLFSIFILKKRKLFLYLALTILEVLVHVCAATFCIGWDAGFSMYTMPIVFIAFYMRYIFNDNRFLGKLPEAASFLAAAVFLGLRIITYYTKPIYFLKPEVRDISYLANCAVIFGFIILCMYAYTSLVMNRETNLNERADYDELTQLYNRHKMRDILDKVHEAELAKECGFSTAILDIDDFKKINDTYGHDAGDYVLRIISEFMKHRAHVMEDMADHHIMHIGRWGGEEFLIVQEYDSKLEDYRQRCVDNIESLLSETRNYKFTYLSEHFTITLTAGIAFHNPGEPIAATINRADQLLYSGKESGKNKLVQD